MTGRCTSLSSGNAKPCFFAKAVWTNGLSPLMASGAAPRSRHGGRGLIQAGELGVPRHGRAYRLPRDTS